MSSDNNVSTGSFGGAVTPEQLFIEGQETAENMEHAVVIVVPKGGEGIGVGFSGGLSLATLIGLFDLASDEVKASFSQYGPSDFESD